MQVSRKEYRHLSGESKVQTWHVRLRRRNDRYATLLASLPTFKTPSFSTLLTGAVAAAPVPVQVVRCAA